MPKTLTPTPDYLTVTEVSKALGRTPRWVRDRIRRGYIPAKKWPFPTSPWVIKREIIEEMQEAKKG